MADDERIRLAVFATHPIQYQVPWFQALAKRPELEVKVYFAMIPDAVQQGAGFGVSFKWDIPMLEGYDSVVLRNEAKRPSLGSFGGCDTPLLAGMLRAWAPDLAISTGWHSKMLMQAWLACVRQGVPQLVRGDSNSMRPRAAWKRQLHGALFRGFSQFLAVGKSNRDLYLQAGIAATRIHDCPHFIDNKRFSTTASELRAQRAELRGRWAVPKGVTCFLFSGKLVPKKHPLDLLAALQQASAAGAAVHLLVVGNGELMEAARSAAAAECLPVTFAGFLNQSEIVSAYIAADCLVLPSDTGETWGLVVNEAMACGLPAIVSDQVGCAPDLIIEGITGATFTMGDVDALAQRLVAFAADPAALRAMGEHARERVCSLYSVERAVAGTLAAIDTVRSQR